MVNKKIRRHSGRYTPRLHEKMTYNGLREEALEPQEEYDDWLDHRDGLRDYEGKKRKEREKKKYPYKKGGKKRCQKN